MPQQLLPDKKGQQLDKTKEGTKDENKQQNESTHSNQYDDTWLDLTTVETDNEEKDEKNEGQKK